MGKFVMPKHSASVNDTVEVLRIYYEAGDWLENSVFKAKLKKIIGDDQYPSSYTKKAQFASYFGFLEWQDPTNSRSLRRITQRGKTFYLHYIERNHDAISEDILQSLEAVVFGRNNCGCVESDSDIEPPSLLIRAILDLNHLSYAEYSYLLWKLTECGADYTDAVREISSERGREKFELPEGAKKPAYTDLKLIAFLVELGFLEKMESYSGRRVIINPRVKEQYSDRLQNLKIYNVDKNISSENEEEAETVITVAAKEKLPQRQPREDANFALNSILYGAPGTGKTFATAEIAVAMVEKKSVLEIQTEYPARSDLMSRYSAYIEQERIVFTTFHQSYSYEDFIQGLRPDPKSDKLSFVSCDGVLKKIADRAMHDQNNDYVIIIDEINRANISKVFGELITLIEEDKRWGELNALSATLPSGDRFAVPNNLFILGTMNSADKSISLIDTALRRRFDFVEMVPDGGKIKDPTLRMVFEKLNESLAEELDSTDLLIGHAYFIGKTAADLCRIMNRSIIPLLYEYFYDSSKKVENQLKNALTGLDVIIVNNPFGRIKLIEKEQ